MSTKIEKMNFKVKDMSLSEWGRKEIKLAEAEMPCLMMLREKYSEQAFSLRSKNSGLF